MSLPHALAAWPHLHRPATDPAAPAMLLLHGTGGTEHDLVDLADRISPGSALLAPRGLVSERGASRYFARLAEGVFDPAEVTARTHELADFVLLALRHYKLDTPATPLVALGFSNGANIAATLALLRPDLVLPASILLRSMIVLDRPAAPASLANRRFLLMNGAHDPIVPSDHPPRLASLLRAGGAHVSTTLHPAAAHVLLAEDLRLAAAFLASPAA